MRKPRQYYIIRSVFFSALVYILLIVILAFNSIYTEIPEEEEGVFVELDDSKPKPVDLNQIPKDLLSQEERRNIAVNNAMKDEKESDPYDYSDIKEADDNYKEQLVKEAISDEEYKKIFERKDLKIQKNTTEQNIKKDSDKKETKPSNFQGATYINYFLKDRYKMKIPVPTYKCETSGTVAVNITVNRDGIVISHQITEDSSKDECLRNSAIQSVKASRFNQNYDAPLKQRGTITYIFEAQ